MDGSNLQQAAEENWGHFRDVAPNMVLHRSNALPMRAAHCSDVDMLELHLEYDIDGVTIRLDSFLGMVNVGAHEFGFININPTFALNPRNLIVKHRPGFSNFRMRGLKITALGDISCYLVSVVNKIWVIFICIVCLYLILFVILNTPTHHPTQSKLWKYAKST